MTDVVEYSYNDRNNTIDLLLKSKAADEAAASAYDLSSITRMILKDVGGTWTVDSEIDSDVFDWDLDPAVTGKVVISLGAQSITVGRYRCRLILYDLNNTSGIVWGNDMLVIKVK